MKRPLAVNIAKQRQLLGLTQDKVARRVGIKRGQYQSYEEDRAEPPVTILIRIARVFKIQDLLIFITDENYNKAIDPAMKDSIPTLLQIHYDEAEIKDKLAVNIILGLVEW